jgi:hypothetical protein
MWLPTRYGVQMFFSLELVYLIVALTFVLGAVAGFGRAEAKYRRSLTVWRAVGAAALGGVVALLPVFLLWLLSVVLYWWFVTRGR